MKFGVLPLNFTDYNKLLIEKNLPQEVEQERVMYGQFSEELFFNSLEEIISAFDTNEDRKIIYLPEKMAYSAALIRIQNNSYEYFAKLRKQLNQVSCLHVAVYKDNKYRNDTFRFDKTKKGLELTWYEINKHNLGNHDLFPAVTNNSRFMKEYDRLKAIKS